LLNITGLAVDAEITITHLKGQLVYHEVNKSNPTLTIDLTAQQPGVYFIKIEQNGEIIFRKLVLR
jgi:hypothetical protein